MAKEPAQMNLDEAKKAAEAVSAKHDADVFLYNGTITRTNVLSVMEEIQKHQSRKRLFLVMVTYGGDPHAGFKIARYIQDHFDHVTLFVPGFCKSAGTLFAVAANEVVFAPFGELGPLDVQMAKPDQFQFDSGLVISESLETLERRAAETFKAMFIEVMAEQQGLVSINSALHAASELTKAIYAPIMARIDPEEVGVRQRALRITLDYGDRLAMRSRNIDKKGLRILAEKYSSHSFVIDRQEAINLFRCVKAAEKEEMALASALGVKARIEQQGNLPPQFLFLSQPPKRPEAKPAPAKDANNGQTKRSGNPPSHARNPGGTDGTAVAAPSHKAGRRGRGVRARNSLNGRASQAAG
jgi:hypothetical protein